MGNLLRCRRTNPSKTTTITQRVTTTTPSNHIFLVDEPNCQDVELVSDLFIPEIMAVICEFLPLRDFWTLIRIKPFRFILKQTPLPYVIIIHAPVYTLFHRFCFRRLSFAPFSCNQIDNALVIAMEYNKLQEIELPCISMQAQSTKQLWKFAKKSTHLKRLYFGKNDLNEKTVLDELIDLASSNPHLKQIWLRLELNWLDYLYQQLQHQHCFATFFVSVSNSWNAPITICHSNILILNQLVEKEIELPVIQNLLLRIRSDTKFSLEIKSQADINLSNTCALLNSTFDFLHILDVSYYDYTVGMEPIEYLLRHANYIRTLILGNTFNQHFSKALGLLLSIDKVSILQTTVDMDVEALDLLKTFVKTSQVLYKLVLVSVKRSGIEEVLRECASSPSLMKITVGCPISEEEVEELKQLVPKSIEFEHYYYLKL